MNTNILLVESDINIMLFLNRILTESDFAVTLAQSDLETDEALRLGRFDAVIVVIGSTGTIGADLFSRLRAAGTMPIIALSPRAPIGGASGVKLMADDYVANPFDLKNSITRLLAQDRRQAS